MSGRGPGARRGRGGLNPRSAMSIKFTCTCGQHLRARDDMAARRSLCPRCGRPVGVPTAQTSQRGAEAGPLSPEERRRRAPQAAGAGAGRQETTDTVIVPYATDPFRTPAATVEPLGPRLDLERPWYQVVELPGGSGPANRGSGTPLPPTSRHAGGGRPADRPRDDRDEPVFRVQEPSEEESAEDVHRRQLDARLHALLDRRR